MIVGRVKIILVSLILLGVSACSPIIKIEQPQKSDWLEVSKGKFVGQTFTARYDGLEGIEIFIKPGEVTDGVLTLHVKNHPDDEKDITSSQFPISSFEKSKFYALNFLPQQHSNNQSYYVSIEIDGNSSISLRTAPGESYQNGALYHNDEPEDAQLCFNLIYIRNVALVGIGRELIYWVIFFLLGIFLFIIPGWGLFSMLYSQWSQKTWMEKIALSAGVSLAIYPILTLWTYLVGLHLGALYTWLPPILGLILIIWHARTWIVKPSIPRIKNIAIADIAYLLIAALLFAIRFWAIRNLPAPMWGDAFQHTVISQLIVDNKGLFNSWQPYADITSFTYHFGFHTLVAVFHWISDLSLPQATLWTGQILNGLAVLCLAPLVSKISSNKWGPVIAIALVGLFFQMPMYYLNWGRYTQLAGQIILVVCIYLAWETLEKSDKPWKLLILNCIVMAGLALTHYRVLIFAVCFYIIFLLFHITSNFLHKIILTCIIGMGSLIIFLPWLVHIFSGKILLIVASKFEEQTSQIASPAAVTDAIGNISSYLPLIIWVLILLIFLWGICYRNKPVILIGAWWLVILLAANPQWLGLPGAGSITNFAVFIAAYFPAGIILGGFSGILIENIPKYVDKNILQYKWLNNFHITPLIFASMVIILGGYFGRQSLKLIHPDLFGLITYPDMKAMQWIKQYTPEDSKFLVNSFLAYNDTTSVGSDGGWWLQFLTLRKSTLPPINYGSETNADTNFAQSIKTLTSTIQKNGITSPETWNLIIENNVTHVYVGQKQGKVNYSGPVIDPLALSKDSRFRPIYHEDRVWIFEVVR